MTYLTKATVALLALAASVALVACGSDDDGGETVSGPFELVADAPSRYADLSGEATLERSGGATDASIRLSGLEPDSAYIAHVHAAGCDQPDPGGPHFKFDADGADEPPNEIHLPFTSSSEGEGEAEATSEREVPSGEAGSIVLHANESEEAMEHGASGEGGEAAHEHSHRDKIACAELEGGEEESPSAGTGTDDRPAGGAGASVPTIVVRNGEPVGGVAELEYDAGERVRFRVRSDVADEVHVHGYDLTEDVSPGGSVSFSFRADIEGIFEVELEERGTQIAELTVNP